MSVSLSLEITSILASALVAIAGGNVRGIIGGPDNNNSGDQKELVHQEIDMQLMQVQARVAQEIAIAKRIETADEVEIEEFYEGSREGNAGVQAREGSFSVGLHGYGNKVTRRIYRFKGFDSNREEVYEQNLNNE